MVLPVSLAMSVNRRNNPLQIGMLLVEHIISPGGTACHPTRLNWFLGGILDLDSFPKIYGMPECISIMCESTMQSCHNVARSNLNYCN
jgi:hypothetical protein